MTPPRWWRRIKALGACDEALAWARRYKTYRGMIRGCRRIGWLGWLLLKHPAARAEYERVRAAALAEYERVRAAALAEYDRVCAAAWAESRRVCAAAWAESRRVCAAAWAEYERVCLTAARAACLGLPLGKEE